MPEYIGPHTRPLALFLVVGVAVCDGACGAPRDPGRLVVGGSRAAEATRSEAEDPVSHERRKRSGAPAATSLVLASNVRVCTNTYRPGDRFTATVTDTVVAPNGDMIPAGSLASFRVTEISVNGAPTGAPHIEIVLDSLDIDGVRYPATALTTSIATRRVRPRTAKSRTGFTRHDLLGEPLGHEPPPPVAATDTRREYELCLPQRGRITLTTAALRP
jgi:hypothetical protein